MSTIALFHSAYGLRPAVHDWASRLREQGHAVVVPDLFEGATAASVEEGSALIEEIGRDELLRRAAAAVADHLGDRLAYAGFSFGGAVAQNLALADPDARGLLLLHGTSDVADDAATDIPVQLHVAEPDPFETDDWLTAWYLRMQRAGADVEIHRYRGAGHLYTDPGLDDYDAEAAETTWRVASAFLAELDA